MAALGPWPADRRVAVAVSGGADSLCLARLAAGWGRPFGLIVDHGLRQESAAEAAQTQATLSRLGVASRILTLEGLAAGPGLAARARAARYEALTGACAAAGLADLLLGHHADDQAETVLLRRRAGSLRAGLAGMARIAETPSLRLVRPLLDVPKASLVAILRAQGIGWVEDPSNADQRAARVRARCLLAAHGVERAALLADAREAGEARVAADISVARLLAGRVVLRPEGFALLSPGPIDRAAFATLVRGLTGAPYPARTAHLARVAARPGPCVLAGLRIIAAGRLGEGWLLQREEAGVGPDIEAVPGAVWDGRFRLKGCGALPEGMMLGALREDASRLRRLTDLPSSIMRTLPAIRLHGRLVAVPHIGYAENSCFAGMRAVFSPPNPVCGAPFGR
jgi:tRNA(Ile)-lysidine synthase